ncbi:epimerase [Niastella koreensis]|uniref:UDP-glucuronate 5'-epimerase n=2 Tax=Niastella koreensis TaxID=354356 RepID=G8TKM0_NIAKG|nr:NAD-dependent epimerase/dehydratase family protein [Niastella koreensis]AEV98694.1 UDP-glucuronate 5'-epimerase [Niastella koreensis GR20-10]OQP44937.1 epimerase [Niastella koreensis]
MKRILVTGGAGFIGSNLIKKLLSTGCYHITCLDNFDNFYAREQKELNINNFFNDACFEFIEDDIRNVHKHASLDNIDVIIHLAAKAGVRPSIQEPELYQNVNIGGTQALLEFARKRNIKQFLFASSSSVYGVSPNVPWNENDRMLPISPYACSKYASEMFGYTYSHLYKIRFIALRFFTVYGPAQRPDLAIHKFFNCIHQKKPITIFGNGDTARDYTYIDDIVQGIIAAIDYDASDFEVFNLGNHRTVSLNNLIRNIEQICGSRAILQYYPEQPGDVPLTYADIGKAVSLLNYKPSTDLLSGLGNFYNWYTKNHQLLRVGETYKIS